MESAAKIPERDLVYSFRCMNAQDVIDRPDLYQIADVKNARAFVDGYEDGFKHAISSVVSIMKSDVDLSEWLRSVNIDTK